MADQLSDDQRQKMLQIMATEHSVLQAGRIPQSEKYFVGSIHDDFASTLAPTAYGMPITPGRQSLLTVPGAIAMVNGVIVGAFAGLLVGGFIVDSFVPSVGVGLAAFVVSGWLQRRHQIVRWDQMVRRLPTLFPSKPTP